MTSTQKFDLIGQFKKQYGVNQCCRVLDVFKSSYYYHIHSRTLTIRRKEKEEYALKQKVLAVIEEHPAYGYRRLIPELRKKGVIINHKRLLPLLKLWGISLKRKIVKKLKALISFSRVATPEDNPEMEAFFGRLKDEWKKVFYEATTEEEIIRLISQAVSYYNTKRIHSAHIDKSPDEFLKICLPVKN